MRQSVGRAAARAARGAGPSLSAAREAAGPRATAAVIETISSLDHFVLPLLPVRTLRQLVVGLAKAWQTSTHAGSATVVVGLAESRRKLVGSCTDHQLPQLAESEFSPPAATFDESVADDSRRADEAPAVAIPFAMAADGFAGVLLALPSQTLPSRSLPSETLIGLTDERRRELAQWSGRLIDQALLTEASLVAQNSLEAAKGSALAEFAAGAGHEINNPLATISGRVQILLRDETDPGRRQALATIGAQALRIRDMIGDLMLFGRPPAPLPQRLVLNEAVLRVVDRLAESARSRAVELRVSAAGPVFASADPVQFPVVLSELVRNSLEALGSDGTIEIELSRATISGRSCAVVSVTDDGPGFSETDRAHLFDPFYSGRSAGRGLGFGLCKCWRIVDAHGGSIDVESVPGVATTFRTLWPDSPDREPAEAVAVGGAGAGAGQVPTIPGDRSP